MTLRAPASSPCSRCTRASDQTAYGTPLSTEYTRPIVTDQRSRSARSAIAFTSRVFPMPDGPAMTWTPPCPDATSVIQSPSSVISAARPTCGSVLSAVAPRCVIAPNLGAYSLAASLRPPVAFALPLAVRDVDAFRGSGAKRAFALRVHLRQITLTLADALHFDRDGVEAVIHTRKAVIDVLRQLGHDCRAATPYPSRERDRDGQQNHEHEDASQDIDFVRRSDTGLRCWRMDCTGNGGGLGHEGVRVRNLLLRRCDALIDGTQALLEGFLIDGVQIGLPELRGDVAPLILQPLQLATQFGSLIAERLIDVGRTTGRRRLWRGGYRRTWLCRGRGRLGRLHPSS